MKLATYLFGLALLIYGNAWLCNLIDGDLWLAAIVMADTLLYHRVFWNAKWR